MKTNEKIVTLLEFESNDFDTYICDAMRAAFPDAEWNEEQICSTFTSNSLCDRLLETYFENADSVKSDMTHEFDVLWDSIVQLAITSTVKPILREQNTPALPFTLKSFEQDLLSNML